MKIIAETMKFFLSFNLLTLFLINMCLIIMIYIINRIRNKVSFKATFEELKNSYSIFLKYIDKYYITNFKYTIIASIIYIIGTVFLFLLFRYLFIGQLNMLLRLDTSIIIVNYTLFTKYILFLLGLFLYKSLLQILFFKEIIKLRIYLQQFYPIDQLNSYCNFNFGEHFCKFIWILSYRIATQTFSKDLFEGDYDLWKNNLLDYSEHNYIKIYNNYYIYKVIRKLMLISEKFNFIAYLFYCNAKFFKFLSRHVSNGLFKFVPYMLIILCILYELYNRELYYIYYVTFCYFLYYIISNFRKFERNLDYTYIEYLNQYFYKNDLPYSSQRLYIWNCETCIIINKNSRQNDTILYFFKLDQNKDNDNFGFIFCILTNMIKGNIENIKKYNRQSNFLYLRATIILTFIFINIYIYYELNITITVFNIVISNIVLFLLCLLLMIVAYNILYCEISEEFTKDEDTSERIYNIKYSIIFWILVILQSYICWLILLKPELTFIKTEILIQMPYEILTIKKIYTIEEKIFYLFQYFDFYLFLRKSQDVILAMDEDYLRYILRQIDYNNLITSDITLKDIEVYIKILLDNYSVKEIFNKELIAYTMNNTEVSDMLDLSKKHNYSSFIFTIIQIIVDHLFLLAFVYHKNKKKIRKVLFITQGSTNTIKVLKYLWSLIKNLWYK